MSLYHEAAAILSLPSLEGGSLKTRIFGKKDLKSPPAQVYALALETCKWSPVLKEVVEGSQILQHERKLTPLLSLLLVHDYLLSKGGIALPQSHGLRTSVERHKGRINSEFKRARLRRKLSTVEALRAQVEGEAKSGPSHPRWIRINTLRTSVTDQLEKTFAGYDSVASIQEIIDGATRALCFDVNIPNLIAVSPTFDFSKSEAYKSGAIILQDKASCFPAYLLDPNPSDGDVIDACAAPGNKTTQLGAILHSRSANPGTIFAFEKDKGRAHTLEKMVNLAGSNAFTKLGSGQDFLKVDPLSAAYKNVGALLLDPSCSGSGIIGRDDIPELHLPEIGTKSSSYKINSENRKRKRSDDEIKSTPTLIDDDGKTTFVSSEEDLRARIEALSAFQLSLLLHAFKFPAAKKVVYSTCSIYAGENEHVVIRALQSEVAKSRGWHILCRSDQVKGLRQWPIRGDVDACDGDEEVADSCIRTYKEDGHGVIGFFVAGFVREAKTTTDQDGPYLRDADGRIIRDQMGIPTMKSSGKKAVDLNELIFATEHDETDIPSDTQASVDEDGPYLRDEDGRIIRDSKGMPTLKAAGKTVSTQKSDPQDIQRQAGQRRGSEWEDGEHEWGGFDD